MGKLYRPSVYLTPVWSSADSPGVFLETTSRCPTVLANWTTTRTALVTGALQWPWERAAQEAIVVRAPTPNTAQSPRRLTEPLLYHALEAVIPQCCITRLLVTFSVLLARLYCASSLRDGLEPAYLETAYPVEVLVYKITSRSCTGKLWYHQFRQKNKLYWLNSPTIFIERHCEITTMCNTKLKNMSKRCKTSPGYYYC